MQPNECTILYVEDEIIIALDTAQTLQEMGFAKVHVANNLRRARALADDAGQSLDCALLDVNIAGEGMSLDFGRALMACGVHVVFASGYNRHEMEEEHPGLVFVEKPLSPQTIRAGFRSLGLMVDG